MASAVSACVTSVASLPIDNMKTKLMKMQPNEQGVLPYKGLSDCFAKTLKKEGVRGFWAGLPTFVCRVGPHSMITLMMVEYLKKLIK